MAGGSNTSKAQQEAAAKFYETSKFKVWFYLAALIMAYFAKYFCTSFLYIVQALWLKDQQITKQQIAYQFILGYCMSMIGKRAAGNWADKWGGKNVQMLSLGVYIPVVIIWSFGDKICEVLGLGLGHRWPVFLSFWLCNGFFALGLSGVAIMVCASNWIPKAHEGRLLAVIGCAPELGDSSARAFLGPIIKHGWSGFTFLQYGAAGDWRTVSLSAALAAIVLSLPMFLFVEESPPGYEAEKDEETKAKKAAKAKKDAEKGAQSGGFLSGLKPDFTGLDMTLMTLTCTMCGLLYAIRTMFLLDSVTWLSEVYCTQYHPNEDFDLCRQNPITVGNVASASLLFTFFGMFSVLLAGQIKDWLQAREMAHHRGWILFGNSCILLVTVSIMLTFDLTLSFSMATFLVGMIGFGDFGPYKLMSGAFAVDIGGKMKKGDVSAWMGVASNGCAAIILCISGFIPEWTQMFKILIVLACGCMTCALLIVKYDYKKKAEKDGGASAREPHMREPLLAA